jgi:hypothetical protein
MRQQERKRGQTDGSIDDWKMGKGGKSQRSRKQNSYVIARLTITKFMGDMFWTYLNCMMFDCLEPKINKERFVKKSIEKNNNGASDNSDIFGQF